MDADGEDYTRALALGTQTALTVCGWFYLSVDRNTWSTIFSIDNGTSDNWLMQTSDDGVTMSTVFDASTQQGIGAMTVGTWYFICLATSGTTGNLYYRTASNPTLTTVAVTSVTANVNAATLRLGESPWGGEWWNGRIAAVQVYTVQLSAAEAHQESMQYAPRRLTNLVAWYPLVKPETADYSGNARTLSGGAGATTEDGPPIPWVATSPRLVLPAPTAGGTLAIGQAVETDTASAVTRAKTRGVAQASETDTATTTARVKTRGIATAAETDTATAVARVKTQSIGAGVETDTGSPVTIQGQNIVAIGQAAETDTATPVTRTKIRPIGLAAETNTAQPLAIDGLEFVCQDFSGTAQPVTHAGSASVAAHGGDASTVAYAGSTALVSYGGTATLCGR
jgi:hypothetical protein